MPIIFPSQTGVIVPRGRLRIDWSNPLTNGLINCYIPGISPNIDLVRGLFLTYNGTETPNIDVEGPCFRIPINSNAGGASAALVAADPLVTWTAMTLYWRGALISGVSPQAFGYHVAVMYASPYASPYVLAAIECGSVTQPYLAWNSAGGTGGTSAFGAYPAAGVPFSIAGTFLVNGNGIGYFNGASSTSTAFGSGAPTTTASAYFNLMGGLPGLNRAGLGMDCFITAAWNRVLSAAEIAFLDQNPYDFILSDEGEWPCLYTSPPINTYVFLNDPVITAILNAAA